MSLCVSLNEIAYCVGDLNVLKHRLLALAFILLFIMVVFILLLKWFLDQREKRLIARLTAMHDDLEACYANEGTVRVRNKQSLGDSVDSRWLSHEFKPPLKIKSFLNVDTDT